MVYEYSLSTPAEPMITTASGATLLSKISALGNPVALSD